MHNFNKYLTPSPVDEKWGFFITSVGYSKIDINQAYPINKEHPATHTFTWNKGRILDDYYLVYISKGKGTFESSETGSFEISAGTCFFLFPGVWHRYKPDPHSGWEEYWVGFKGYYPEYLMNQHFFDKKSPFIQVGLNVELQQLFHKLLDCVKSSISGYHQIISGITLQMLGMVNSIALNEYTGADETSRAIARAKFRMRESIEKPIEIDKLLEEIPMSYSKFRQAFKKTTGQSPNQYYLNIRLNKAKELLTATSLNINEIAYHTGFESIFYFSKLFKNKNGISTKDYNVVNLFCRS
jgi:AraC-like DNA-binding protein